MLKLSVYISNYLNVTIAWRGTSFTTSIIKSFLKKIDNNITLLPITHADRSHQLHGGRSCILDHVV
jgi:hypothetical protein